MNKSFGQIPRLNPSAAANVADAARHVEGLLDDDPDLDVLPDSNRFPRPGVDIPIADDSQEVLEEVEPASLPGSQGQDDESHEGATGKVVEEGIEYLTFYKSFRDVMSAPARKRWGIFFIKKRCVALATDMSFSTGESFVDCLDGLAAFLYTHELYHYRFDAHCLQMEATGGLPVYRPYRRLVARGRVDRQLLRLEGASAELAIHLPTTHLRLLVGSSGQQPGRLRRRHKQAAEVTKRSNGAAG